MPLGEGSIARQGQTTLPPALTWGVAEPWRLSPRLAVFVARVFGFVVRTIVLAVWRAVRRPLRLPCAPLARPIKCLSEAFSGTWNSSGLRPLRAEVAE